MKIVIAMNLPYRGAIGGANKANRALAESLAREGHVIHIVARSCCPSTAAASAADPVKAVRSHQSLYVHDNAASIPDLILLMDRICTHVQPDYIFVSSEDPMQLLLARSLEQGGARTVILAHSPGCIPCGPHSFHSSARGRNLYKRAHRIVSFSRATADYLWEWLGVTSVVCRLPSLDRCSPPIYDNYHLQTISMANVCAYKGRDIFVAVARKMQHVRFIAATGWGTTTEDRELLRGIRNVTLIEGNPDVESLFACSSVMVVPSLCFEGSSLMSIESLLRSIPVVISDLPGLKEATRGSAPAIAVKPITCYKQSWDEAGLWQADIPAQETEQWVAILSELLAEEASYDAARIRGLEAMRYDVADPRFKAILDLLQTC